MVKQPEQLNPKYEKGNFFIYLNKELPDGRNRFYSSFLTGWTICDGGLIIMASDDDNHESNQHHTQCISKCYVDKIIKSGEIIYQK